MPPPPGNNRVKRFVKRVRLFSLGEFANKKRVGGGGKGITMYDDSLANHLKTMAAVI